MSPQACTSKLSLDAMSLANRITFEVTLGRGKELAWRLWIARQLITLAARIAHVQLRLTTL